VAVAELVLRFTTAPPPRNDGLSFVYASGNAQVNSTAPRKGSGTEQRTNPMTRPSRRTE